MRDNVCVQDLKIDEARDDNNMYTHARHAVMKGVQRIKYTYINIYIIKTVIITLLPSYLLTP